MAFLAGFSAKESPACAGHEGLCVSLFICSLTENNLNYYLKQLHILAVSKFSLFFDIKKKQSMRDIGVPTSFPFTASDFT